MGFTKKSHNKGMGFLLVFFPEEQQTQTKKNLFSSSSSSTHLLHKAQSTISICLLLLFTTLLVFTLSTLPSNNHLHIPYHHRRHLREAAASSTPRRDSSASNLPHALQGVGTLYRRGTRAMSDLIVAHSVESMSLHELRLFVRLLYRSAVASRSDVVFLFPSKRSDFDDAIFEETQYFFNLLSQSNVSSPPRGMNYFDPADFFLKTGKKKEKETGEPIWGRKIRANSSGESESGSGSIRLSYGSVVGFEADELDPENALSAFLDHAAVPMSLRRWVCYPMLLGRVRHNFKHVVLVDAKEMLLLGDPLSGGARSQSPETVTIRQASSSSQPQSRHGRKNTDKNGSTRVHQGFITGGSRGIRRLSNAMLMGIVRTTSSSSSSQHRKKISVTESSIFNQLVGNESALKDVNKILSGETIPDLGSLVGSGPKPRVGPLFNSSHAVVRRGNSNLDVNNLIMKHICSFAVDSMVYSDC